MILQVLNLPSSTIMTGDLVPAGMTFAMNNIIHPGGNFIFRRHIRCSYNPDFFMQYLMETVQGYLNDQNDMSPFSANAYLDEIETQLRPDGQTYSREYTNIFGINLWINDAAMTQEFQDIYDDVVNNL